MSTFIEGKIPEDKEIIDQMSRKAFEVESVEVGEDGDPLFEIKVLPNRVADAMSISGMASELCSVFDLKYKNDIADKINLSDYKLNDDFVSIKESENLKPVLAFCGLKVKIDKQIETPEWIKDILIKSGGRPINSLVDITNLVLFSFGQPAHVFDADKLSGKLIPRFANKGEEIELLGEKKIILESSDFVIADEKNALALAGIKGGKKAEVDGNTTNALFEIANFNSSMVRLTSTRLSLRTDASKIYENGISTEKTHRCLKVLMATLKEIYPEAQIEFIFNKSIEEKTGNKVNLSVENVNNSAGKDFSKKEVEDLLKRQGFVVHELEKDLLEVIPPADRLDINIEADVIEEVLRIYGFDNIESKELVFEKNIFQSTRFLFENYLKVKLLNLGYTEIFNYTFGEKGNVKVKLGLASDKEYLRCNLLDGANKAFTKNYLYLPVLESDTLKFFEIGTVFIDDNTEEKRMIIVCDDNKKKTKYVDTMNNILTDITSELGLKNIEFISKQEKPAILEFSIDKVIQEIVEMNVVVPFLKVDKDLQSIKYSPISVYPFIGRDVAVWVPDSFDFASLKEDIVSMKLANFEKIYKFDEFEKEGKKSIAFRIIFQSYEKTLTDAEIEVEMQKVITYLKERELEIR